MFVCLCVCVYQLRREIYLCYALRSSSQELFTFLFEYLLLELPLFNTLRLCKVAQLYYWENNY